MSTYSDYRKNMVQRFWKYQDENFSDWKEYFERPFRKCSWRRITNHLRGKNEFSWLVEQLELKYGL